MQRAALLALVQMAAGAAATVAQVIEPPPRSPERPQPETIRVAPPATRPRTTGGIFGGHRPSGGGRPTHQLTFILDLLAGYDDNLSPNGDGAPTDPVTPAVPGGTGTVASLLDYRLGTDSRGIEASARSVLATYSGIDVGPLVGGRGNVRAYGRTFDRMTLDGWTAADYQPTFLLGPAGTSTGPDATPIGDPTVGVTDLRSVNASAGASLSYDWTRRHHTSGRYTYSNSQSHGSEVLSARSHSAVVGHMWDAARSLGLQGSYMLSHQHAGLEMARQQSVDTRTVTGGAEVRVRVSPTRRMTFAGSGGATAIRTRSVIDGAPIDYMTPSYSGSVRMDIFRTWAASADLSRTVTMIEGLTQQSFVTAAGSLWVGGSVGRRSTVAFSGTYADGVSHAGDSGSYVSRGAVVQLQTRLTRCCEAVVSYSFYQHALRDVAVVQPGFPRIFERNAVRVGMTVWLPLFGTFPLGARGSR